MTGVTIYFYSPTFKFLMFTFLNEDELERHAKINLHLENINVHGILQVLSLIYNQQYAIVGRRVTECVRIPVRSGLLLRQ